jgi:hypothetical protein
MAAADPDAGPEAQRGLRARPFIVDNPLVAVVVAFCAGALAGSELPGRGLIWRAGRMLVFRELEVALAALLPPLAHHVAAPDR